MSKLRRPLRIVALILLPLFCAVVVIAVKIRLALGPELKPPPLLLAAPSQPAFLFRDVSLFVGTELTLRLHQDVLVRGDRIIAVAATGIAAPADAEVIDGKGHTLLPGFIDAHTHIDGSGASPGSPMRVPPGHNLEAYAYSGVTTAYVLGGLAENLAKLRQEVEAGRILGPMLYYTHLPITAPGGHPIVVGKELVPWPISAFMVKLIPQPSDVQGAERAVATTAEHHVHLIKAMHDRLPPTAPLMADDVLKAIAEATHRRGLKLFVHIGTIEDALAAARAGADVLAHGVYRGKVTPAQAEELARYRIPLIYTMVGWVRTAELAHGRLVPTPLDIATVPRPILDSVSGEAGRAFTVSPAIGAFVAALLESEPFWRDNLRTLHAAGVPLLVGTDSPLPGIFPGSSYQLELALLAAGGVSNGEVLIAATSRAADVLGLDVGRVEVGKIADLLLVRGDPVANLSAAADIELLLLRGKPVHRAK